uniref:Truncated ORF1 n=1 Tax=Porcine circovirus 2 TaxID=85708 RepID=A0A097HUV9_PCV2|nr:truncated ORF1 [Porcine circovirus 2]
MPSKKNGRSGPQPHKRWVFTLNNPSEDERKKIRELPSQVTRAWISGPLWSTSCPGPLALAFNASGVDQLSWPTGALV